MPAKKVPITGPVLAWAREEGGYSLEALAEKLTTSTKTISAETIASWESGDEQPTQGQFTNLWKALKRPSALFFLQEPPANAGMPAELRNTPGSTGRPLTPDELLHVRRARRLQDITSWVLKDNGSRPLALNHYKLTDDAYEVGEKERSASGISVEEQLEWPNRFGESGSKYFSKWREFLESRGILVFLTSMRRKGVRGFGIWDDYAPVVVVNTAYHPTARIFTLFHEFAHLLTRSSKACQDFVNPKSQGPKAERWCEQFSAAFLIPSDRLIELASEKRITRSKPTSDPQTARNLAKRFFVSARAMALRLQELDLASNNLYSNLIAKFPNIDWKKGGGGGGGQRAPETRLREYGERTTQTLLSAQSRGRLNERDLTDYFRLDIQELGDLRELVGHS